MKFKSMRLSLVILAALALTGRAESVGPDMFSKLCQAAKQTVVKNATPPVLNVFDSLLMTASNLPSPLVATADSEYSASYRAYQAFDAGTLSYWNSAQPSTFPHWIQYDAGAGNSNTLSTVLLVAASNSGTLYGYNSMVISGSVDGVTYTSLLVTNALSRRYQVVTNSTPGYYRYFKLVGLSGYSPDGAAVYGDMRLSSAVYINPVMTASNVPSPCKVTADCDDGTSFGYTAFDYAYGTYWQTAAASNFPHWIIFDFGADTLINGLTVLPAASYGFKNYNFDASADATTWITIGSSTMSNAGTNHYLTTSNTTAYRYYRLYGTNGWQTKVVSISDIVLKRYPTK